MIRTPFLKSALLTAMFALAACSHSQPKHDYPASANGATEIQSMEQNLRTAVAQNVPVLSPSHFDQAQHHFNKARELQLEGKSNEDVLGELAYARGHLDAAMATAQSARAQVSDIEKVRQEAVTAKAPEFFPKEFKKADEELRDYTADFEKGKMDLSADDRAEVLKRYQDLELAAIKRTHLGEAAGLIDTAKNMGAEKHSPQTLNEAQARFKTAEAAIDANRHNPAAFQGPVMEATLAARKAHDVTEIVRNSRGKSAEAIALEIQARTDRIEKQRSELSQEASKVASRDSAIANLSAANRKLSARERLDASLEKARALFSKDEAEVYRQGDRLLIRLKQIQFPTNRTELPSSSFTTLAKTKEVIAMLDADKVVVEGHTDSVGGKAVNQSLSEKRAEAVAEYLVSDDVVPSEKIESVGYGFEKPLTSNKTKEGRAQNRRVDLVITPTGARTGVAE